MSTEDLKPFTISEGEGLSDSDREYMKTGEIPEGFAPSEEAPSADKVVVTIPGEEPPPVEEHDDSDDDAEVAVKVRDTKTGQFKRMVPHKALHGEREEHKKTKAELATMREQFTAGDARIKLLYQLAGVDPETGQSAGAAPSAKASPLEEKDIPFTEDPIKAWEQMQRRQAFLVTQLGERGKAVDGLNERLENQNTNTATKAWLESDIRSFVGKQPAFGMAWNHVIDGIRKELIIGGTPEDQVEQELNRRQEDFFKSARAKNKSGAQLIWDLAGARGFKAPEIVIGKDGKPTLKQKGPAPGTQEAAQQLTNIKKGQEASASLSKSGGGATEELTLARLATMDEEGYAAIRKKLGKDGMKQYLGA